MNADAIRQLVFRLPPESPYFRAAFRNQPEKTRNLNLAQRWAVALNDPAFLWNLSFRYAEAGLPLPSFVWNSAALRANCFLLYRDHPDYHVAIAQSLNLPQMRAGRDLLRALLCCRDLTLEQIAEMCQLPLDVVRLFSELFWNFRDRVDDPIYVTQLLFRHTRFPGAQEQADPGLRLVRLGYQKGAQAVLQAAGLATLANKCETAAVNGQIHSALVSHAALGLDLGLTNEDDNPALAPALQLLLRERAKQGPGLDADDLRGLGGMSLGRSIMETFLEKTRPDIEHQIALQNQGFEKQLAAANQRTGEAPVAPATPPQTSSDKPDN
jgi:hypothetical protein